MWLQFKLRGEEVKDRYKFRVWNNFQKKMFTVYQIDYRNMLIYAESEENTTHTFGFIDCVLMQCYGGSSDVNGVKIFEGDLVKFTNRSNDIVTNAPVVFYCGCFKVIGVNLCEILLSHTAEIIGNIHDGN